ncbi:MAG: DNA replication complex GINS family protein [Candidatus Diapherotrites archaeon]|nr:DNA replication complex GINS family protein [Candidatus Diapherotrites archaeon]
MNYEEIRNIQRKEQNSSRIVEIDSNFYQRLADFVKEKTEAYKKTQDPTEFRELENVVKLARRVFDSREQKIVMKALRSVRMKEYDDKTMTPEEKEIYAALVNVLKKHRKFFEGVLIGNYQFNGQKKQGDSTTLINGENNNILLVRIRKSVPRFVGADSKEYGPFKANDIVKLPKREADLLKDQGLAEVV